MTMTQEDRDAYNQCVRAINAMTADQIEVMLASGTCPNRTELLRGVSLGMFHCEVCGTMVVAGAPHQPIDQNCR